MQKSEVASEQPNERETNLDIVAYKLRLQSLIDQNLDKLSELKI